MARLITLGVLIGIISLLASGNTVAAPLSYNDCLSAEGCLSVSDSDTISAIKAAIKQPPPAIDLNLAIQASASNPGAEEEINFQDEISEYLSNHQNRSFDKKDQSEYASFHYRKDITGFSSVRFTNEEREHINSVIEDTFTTSKASRDLLNVTFDKNKKSATTTKVPSDPYMLHKIIAFHVALVLIALIFFKVSDR